MICRLLATLCCISCSRTSFWRSRSFIALSALRSAVTSSIASRIILLASTPKKTVRALSSILRSPKPGEFALDLELVHAGLVRQDLAERAPQFGNVPLAPPQQIDELPLDLVRAHLERLVEGSARRDDPQFHVEHDKRLADGVHNRLGQRVSAGEAREGIGDLHEILLPALVLA